MVSAENYDAIKERARDRSAKASRKGRDIGAIPDIFDPERRAACEFDLELYLKTYLWRTFYLEFSDNHRQIIKAIQKAIIEGGRAAYAMPRGTGKTSIAEGSTMWAVSFGHRRFVVPIGATEGKAQDIISSIKTEFETNERLTQDFPEICYPIQALEGIINRCGGQLCEGERTNITWTGPEIVLPTIAGSKCSGSVIKAAGLLGAIRGLKAKLPTGETIRPDFVIPDDPQTDDSALSPTQCAKRIRVLNGAVLGLAGPGVDISAVMPCTVIAQNDLSDTILDRKKNPAWHGVRTKLLESWPKNMKLWDEYAELRRTSHELDRGPEEENQFYSTNQAAMDEGAIVSWNDRKKESEVSAIQHAMNLWIDLGDEAFNSEFQNDPLTQQTDAQEAIDPDAFRKRVNNCDRGRIPGDAELVTAFIDVQKNLLWYVVCAFTRDFDWKVVDYGTYPDQKRTEFTNDNAKLTMQGVSTGTSLEEAIYEGLETLTDSLLGREWIGEDGSPHHVAKCLIDANWGQMNKLVFKFCRQSKHAQRLNPSAGRGIGAAKAPMSTWKKEDGDQLGDNWINRKNRFNSGVRGVMYDTNYWKSFFLQRTRVGMGGKGALSLFGAKPEAHRLFARHMASEFPVRVCASGGGREVDEWQHKANQDNHWLDGIVGCGVAASMLGCSLKALKDEKRKKKKRRGGGVSYMNV